MAERAKHKFMVGNNPISLSDVKRILRRWWWILPITTVFFGGLGTLAAMVLPKKYMSQTMVLVEQPTVSDKIVPPVINEDLSRRLESMQQQILSRSRLQPVIEKLNLYPGERGKVHMEDLVDRLRSSVKITPLEPMAGTQNRQFPGFYINVTFSSGQLAQQICTEITSMFVEANATKRGDDTKLTVDFVHQALGDAKKKLDDQDAKLAAFKQKYPYEQPGEETTNLGLLTGMNTQLESNTQSLSRAQQEKALTESLLAQQEAIWKQQNATNGVNPDSLDQQLAALQDKLLSLQAIYTPQHPDVLKTQHAIEDLKKRMEEQQKAGVANTPAPKPNAIEPPQLQQLRARLRQEDLNIADLTKAQVKIQGDIRVLQGRIQSSPLVEQEFKDLTRDYQTASENYNDLLKKNNSAELAGVLEGKQESETFNVFDPPSLPNQPSFPNKFMFAGGGLGGGLALGLGILYLIAAMDKSLHSERDVELGLKLPLLVSIPALDVVASQAKRVAGLADRKLQPQPKGISA